VRLVLAVLLVSTTLLGQHGPSVSADQAPFWDSPTGLVPGNPSIQVRMASETVEIDVAERGESIYALVQATFTMVNDGETTTTKVGFPASTTSLFDGLVAPDASGARSADAPGLFNAQTIRAFDVAVDGESLANWRQTVEAAAQAGYGQDWAMWEMTFPAGETRTVAVTYEQVLTERATDQYVQPMYVLRTGALWHGAIGEATVTIRAERGGALIGGPELYWRLEDDGSVRTYPRLDQVYGAADAVERSTTRLSWRFRDFEPTRDVGTTYVRSSAWRAFSEADRAVVLGGANDSTTLRRAADAALDILGGPKPCLGNQGQLCVNGRHATPRGLVELLGDAARERARRAVQLAPDDPDTLRTFGDAELWFAMPTRKHHGELGCWPSNAVDAYEQAQTLGASDARIRLDTVRAGGRGQRYFDSRPLRTCSGAQDVRLEVEQVKATVEQGNQAWANGVGRYGTAEAYSLYFAGRWLEERTAEVAQLRRNRQDRRATLQAFEFTRVEITDDLTASAETDETWEDRTLSESGQPVRDVSGRLRQRYELRKVDGFWKIVEGQIIRA
jgi:hypothetical protein